MGEGLFLIWSAKKCFVIHPDNQKRTAGSGSVYNIFRIDAKPIQRTHATRCLGVDLMPTGIGTKYTLERVTSAQRRLRGLVVAKYIKSEMPPSAVRMVYKTFVRSIYAYALALTPLLPKIICEVTKLKKLFFHAILRVRYAIKPRMLPVLRSLFKLESLKHRRFELQHRSVSRMMCLVGHGKGNTATQAKQSITALNNLARHT